jgi:hypothetical protein
VLLYLHPQIPVRSSYELYAGYVFLQELFRQHLQGIASGARIIP